MDYLFWIGNGRLSNSLIKMAKEDNYENKVKNAIIFGLYHNRNQYKDRIKKKSYDILIGKIKRGMDYSDIESELRKIPR